jgi:DNA-binding winged helix-turn-helix (wHTH) protein
MADPIAMLDSRRLQFAEFVFDCATSSLYREGIRIHLQEQPSQVLAALVERPGEIVARDALRERLWKSDTFVDFEHGLNTAVKKLRQALGDSAETPAFIETLPRRGYRFIAPVRPVSPPAEETVVAQAIPAPGITAETRRIRASAAWVAAVGMVILIRLDNPRRPEHCRTGA